MPARTLVSLLAPERIRVGLVAESKDDLLQSLVELAASHESVQDPDRVLRDVRAREAKLSTGVGSGLALPHARTVVDESLCALATLRQPVDFEALDGEPVHLVLLLVGPEADRSAHLHLLGRISRVLSDPEVHRALAAAATPDEALGAIRAAEARVA